jgi:hypothetical protein
MNGAKDDFHALEGGSATANDMANRFVKFTEAEQKPFLYYAHDMTCPAWNSNDPASPFPDLYSITSAVWGHYISPGDCKDPYTSWLKPFSYEVVRQAERFAHKKFKLNGTPDVDQIKVGIRFNKTLYPLKKGAQWNYLLQTNEIELQWWKIHMPYSQVNDRLVVDY